MTNMADHRPRSRWEGSNDSLGRRIQATACTAALALMLLVLWTLTHGDQGLTRDAHIYAFQALAKIHPALANDLYLQNTSQDRFTIFSSIYAACIKSFGLTGAGALLLGLCTVWFLAAAWQLARLVSDRELAWLAVGLLIFTVGQYGAYQVFHFSEDYLTARSPAEALVVTALACHYGGWRRLALLIAVAAIFVHPLMALPGLLLLICLWFGIRVSVAAALTGLLGLLGLSLAAEAWPAAARIVDLMDPQWLEVVRERSQFLFLTLWKLPDWESNARPFLCLALTAMAVTEERTRRLCAAALLVGAAGLGVALIASLFGPIAILLQGQAWRWVWITSLICILLMPATVMRVWREPNVGPLCAILLLSAWIVAVFDGAALAMLALAVWVFRRRIKAHLALLVRCATVVFALFVLVWIVDQSWLIVVRSHGVPINSSWLVYARKLLNLQITAALICWSYWLLIKRCRTLWVPALWCAALIGISIVTLPAAYALALSRDWTAPTAEFLDWQRNIPPTDNVYVAKRGDSPIFTWFTLRRPSYLSVDQSAGVVFSRATALEVKRRADNLRPLMAPDWRLLSKNRRAESASAGATDGSPRPLTAAILVGICKDPALKFFVGQGNVGFDPLPHERAGIWKGWFLYDCRRVRELSRKP